MVHQNKIEIETRRHGEMHELTDRIAAIVRESEISVGTVNIANLGSTGAIGCIEFKTGLEQDLPELLDKLIPRRCPDVQLSCRCFSRG